MKLPDALRQPIQFRRLGRMDWERAREEQERTAEAILRGEISATVLFVEHDPVYTHGVRFQPENFLHGYDPATGLYRGAPVRRAWRGGDVTYHGPGQLVVYPILRLERGGSSLRSVVDLYLRIVLESLASLGIEGRTLLDAVGVWTDRGKIASVGIGLRRGVTQNGFAVNVSVNPGAFEPIVACGRREDSIANVNDFIDPGISVDDMAGRIRKVFVQATERGGTSPEEKIR